MSPSASPSARHARAVLLSLLLAATLAAGVAAHVLGRRGPASGGGGTSGASASAGPLTAHAALDRSSVLRGGDGLVRALLTLEGRAGDGRAKALPTDLIVILDNSGSMAGEPLFFAKAAVRELVAGLRPADRFALVRYATDAAVAIPLTPAGPDARAGFESAIESIQPEGGTHMSAGLDLAHDVAARTDRGGRALRVILLSDGHANQGDFSFEGLSARARRAVAQEYVLSSVGVGQGFDETLMSALADAGTGNFYYLPDVQELAGVFADEFASARETVASGLQVALALAPGIELVDAAGYPLEREGSRVVFRPGDLFAGQQRRVWLTLRAPTDRERELALGEVSLGWRQPDGARRELPALALPQLACVASEDAYYASFDEPTYRSSTAESLGVLKERVAQRLRDGRQEEAVAEVDAFERELKVNHLRALGYVVSEDAEALSALRSTAAAPAAAKPEVQQQLGKQLLQEGRDDRRSGSKYSK